MDEPAIRFLIGGVQKCGTTALAAALARHPGLSLPDRKPGQPPGSVPVAWAKEAHVFDGPDFDEAWTPADIDREFALRFSSFGDGRLQGDATPLSVYHPRVVERVARYHPAMRWIVLLRDPVERAISHYFMERARGNERRSLLRAVLAEPARLRGSFASFSREAAWRRASYVDRGRYHRQLAVLLARFPRDQVLLLRSRDLSEAPDAVLPRVFAFLGVDANAVADGGPEGRGQPPVERVFEGDYRSPGALSPGRLLLGWRLRGEVDALRDAYGVDLSAPGGGMAPDGVP